MPSRLSHVSRCGWLVGPRWAHVYVRRSVKFPLRLHSHNCDGWTVSCKKSQCKFYENLFSGSWRGTRFVSLPGGRIFLTLIFRWFTPVSVSFGDSSRLPSRSLRLCAIYDHLLTFFNTERSLQCQCRSIVL
jgi:hypothetical protein